MFAAYIGFEALQRAVNGEECIQGHTSDLFIRIRWEKHVINSDDDRVSRNILRIGLQREQHRGMSLSGHLVQDTREPTTHAINRWGNGVRIDCNTHDSQTVLRSIHVKKQAQTNGNAVSIKGDRDDLQQQLPELHASIGKHTITSKEDRCFLERQVPIAM